MPVLNNDSVLMTIRSFADEKLVQAEQSLSSNDNHINYFDLLDEKPDFSEAAILLEDGYIEYSYVKTGSDGNHYFGFDRCSPDSHEYAEILVRHQLSNKMEANTFEHYPSGKTVLSRRGKILEIKHPDKK